MELRRILSPFKSCLGRQSSIWDTFKSPWLRLLLFRDEVDVLYYALSLARTEVVFVQVGSNDGSNDARGRFFERRIGAAS